MFCLLALAVWGLVGCGKPSTRDKSPVAETRLLLTKKSSEPLLGELLADVEDVSDREIIISDQVLKESDGGLPNLLESIRSLPDELEKSPLLTAFYEELDLRAEVVRLPLMLELAREPAADESLRASLLAELGATLNADHGQAWDAWAQALEAHLKEEHGLLDLRENTP